MYLHTPSSMHNTPIIMHRSMNIDFVHAQCPVGVRTVVIAVGKPRCRRRMPDVPVSIYAYLHDAVQHHWALSECLYMTPYGVIGVERVN